MTGLKTWNGSEWVAGDSSAFNGSEHVGAPVKVWDGSQWVRVDQPAIPDYVDYQWRTPISGLSDGDSVSTWPDSAGDNDGSGTGVTYSEGGFNGDDSVDGSSTDAIVRTAPLDLVMQESWTWAFTYRSTQDSRAIMGQDEGSSNYWVRWDVFQAGSGEPEFSTLTSADNEGRVSGSTNVHDGNIYSIVLVKNGNDPSNWEVWVGEPGGDITQESTTVENGNTPDLSGITPSADFTIFDRDQEDLPIDADIHWMELSGQAWTQTEVEEFHQRVGFSNGGGGTATLSSTTISNSDGDGSQSIDMTGSGSVDLAVAGDANGEIRWYDNDDGWAEYVIASGYQEAEGIDAADVDGDGNVEVFVLDQYGENVDLLTQDTGDPTGSWSTTTLDTDAVNCNHTLMADVTGDGDTNDLIYSVEGTQSGEGGLYWLEHTGGSVGDASNWSKHTIVQEEGTWGIARRRADLSGDGNADDVAFTARANQNSASTGGVWYASPPSDPTNQWNITTVDTDENALHIGVGDFTGNGSVNDIVACRLDGSAEGVYWYDGSNNYARSTIESTGTSTGEWLNVRAWPTDSGPWHILASTWGGDESALNGDLHLFTDDGGSFSEEDMVSLYKADDRWPIADYDGDGEDEFATSSESGYIEYWTVTV